MEEFKSGFVSLFGRANVGKSTLMNCLIKEKISIVSKKPQTTRNKIKGILNKDDIQIIFIDTPGIYKSKTKLGSFMMKESETSLDMVDIILFLIEPKEKINNTDYNIIKKLKKIKSNVFLIINKIDTIKKDDLLKIIDNYRSLYDFKEIIPISAIKGDNIEVLLDKIKNYLNEGPKYFPNDITTDQTERQIVSEIIREKMLYLLQDEIPHGIAIEITKMKNRTNKDIIDIDANIYVEKNSHKPIVIGKNGNLLKKIGLLSRKDIENLLESKVYLQLWVKIKKDWRDNNIFLKNFGYSNKN